MEDPRICPRCGNEFTPWHFNVRYCSEQCRRAIEARRQYARKRAAEICPWCKKNPSPEGYALCDGCRAKGAQRNRDKTIEQRARRGEWKKNWVAGKPDYYHESSQRAHHKLRAEVFERYGDRCACCGLEDWRFLTIDHIDGNGNTHRRETFNGKLVAGIQFYRWLRKNNYPEGFQLLCYNCNCAQSRFMGVCPHKLPSNQI